MLPISTNNRTVFRAIASGFQYFRTINGFGSLSYCKSNLSLIPRETMRLRVNIQFLPFPVRSKSISSEQICYKISPSIAVKSQYCLLFSTSKKRRPKTKLERCYQCSVSIQIFLDFKVCFCLITCKVNRLIVLRSTSHFTEISAS